MNTLHCFTLTFADNPDEYFAYGCGDP